MPIETWSKTDGNGIVIPYDPVPTGSPEHNQYSEKGYCLIGQKEVEEW